MLSSEGGRRLSSAAPPVALVVERPADEPATPRGDATPPPLPRSARPAGVPRPLTPLIGRAAEVAAVQALLRRPDVRLVTLVGAPGVGKSRLGLAVAAAARPQFAHGTALVALAAVRNPALVLSAIARAVGASDQGSRPLRDTLLGLLRTRELLLLLDNCEHVLSAAPLIGELLAHCPGLKVLATSRAPLHLYGEQEYPLAPLALPDPARAAGVAELAESAAVALFVERAQAVQPAFALSADNGPRVAEICRRLEGLPLAIELAAARVKVLSPAAILARLPAQLELLAGGPRDHAPRQQTLRGLLDWSYDLLDAPARALLRRLAVFAGGWTLEAAEGICTDEAIPVEATLPLLGELVDQSLVVVAETESGGRYRLLEPVRQYAEARLQEASEHDWLRDRHRDWYLALAESARLHDWVPGEAARLDRLEVELDNLRLAVEYTRAQRDGARGLRFALALGRLWGVRGYLTEGRDHLVSLLALAHDARESRAWVDAAHYAMSQAALTNDMAGARAVAEDSLAAAEAIDYAGGMAIALTMIAITGTPAPELRDAVPPLDRAIALARGAQDRRAEYWALWWRGAVALMLGEHDEAGPLLEAALALVREQGDEWCLTAVLTLRARVAVAAGDRAAAREYLREGLMAARDLGSKMGIMTSLYGLAAAAGAESDAPRAARLLGAAEALQKSMGASHSLTEEVSFEPAVAAVRAWLDEAAFEAYRAEGAAMGLEAAMGYALTSDAPAARPAEPRGGGLTPREREVARLVARGHTNRQIAAALGIAERTVETHVGRILSKRDLNSRSQLAVWAVRQPVDQGAAIP